MRHGKRYDFSISDWDFAVVFKAHSHGALRGDIVPLLTRSVLVMIDLFLPVLD